MSHDGLAARVNKAGNRHGLVLLYDHASVRRWIRDATVPRGQVPDVICEILSARLGRTVTLSDAGLDRHNPEDEGTPLAQAADAATALWRGDYKRATALHRSPAAHGPAAIAPVYEWENPPDDLDVSRHAGPRVSREQVRALRAARARYESMYRVAGGIPVRPRITELLAVQVTPLVKGSYDDVTGWSCSAPLAAWRRWPGSAPTMPTCRLPRSVITSRRSGWPRRPGTAGSAGT